jgi:hypothetical protein
MEIVGADMGKLFSSQDMKFQGSQLYMNSDGLQSSDAGSLVVIRDLT